MTFEQTEETAKMTLKAKRIFSALIKGEERTTFGRLKTNSNSQ